MIVTCATSSQVGQQVESQLAIGLGVLYHFVRVLQASCLAVELSMGKRPGLFSLGDV